MLTLAKVTFQDFNTPTLLHSSIFSNPTNQRTRHINIYIISPPLSLSPHISKIGFYCVSLTLNYLPSSRTQNSCLIWVFSQYPRFNSWLGFIAKCSRLFCGAGLLLVIFIVFIFNFIKIFSNLRWDFSSFQYHKCVEVFQWVLICSGLEYFPMIFSGESFGGSIFD